MHHEEQGTWFIMASLSHISLRLSGSSSEKVRECLAYHEALTPVNLLAKEIKRTRFNVAWSNNNRKLQEIFKTCSRYVFFLRIDTILTINKTFEAAISKIPLAVQGLCS